MSGTVTVYTPMSIAIHYANYDSHRLAVTVLELDVAYLMVNIYVGGCSCSFLMQKDQFSSNPLTLIVAGSPIFYVMLPWSIQYLLNNNV